MRHTTILPPLLFAALAATTLSQLTTTKPPSYLNQIYANVPWDDTPDILKQCPNNTFGNGGAGVTIFLVDSGCDALHPEFNETAPGQLVNYVIEPTDPAGWQDERVGIDSRGGSTHMASLLVGKKYGIAKQTKIVCIRVYDVVKGSDLPPPPNFEDPNTTPVPEPTPQFTDPGAVDMISKFSSASQERDIAKGIQLARVLAKEEIAAGNTPILVLTTQATLHTEKANWGCVPLVNPDPLRPSPRVLCIEPAPQKYLPEWPSCEWVDANRDLTICHSFLDWQLKGAAEDQLRVIVSAGNENSDSCERSISRITARGYGITIGAVANDGSLWEPLADLPNIATNRGGCVSAYATGLDVPGAWPFDAKDLGNGTIIPGGEYMRNSARTSTATILTAGVAALILNENPLFTIQDVLKVIEETAVQRVEEGGNIKPVVYIPCNESIVPTFTPGPGFSISNPGGISDSKPCVEPLGPISSGLVGIFSQTTGEIDNSQVNGRTIITETLLSTDNQFRHAGIDEIPGGYVLRVGGDTTMIKTIFHDSSALISGTLTKDKFSKAVPRGSIGEGATDLNYTNLALVANYFVESYGNLAPTGTYEQNNKRMVGTDEVVNVFTFDSDETFRGVRIIDVPEGSTIVINIKGKSPSFLNYNLPKKMFGPYTVINFPDMTLTDTLTIQKSWFPGTLITNGIMDISDSYVRGQLIVGKLFMHSTVVDLELFEGEAFPCDLPVGTVGTATGTRMQVGLMEILGGEDFE